MEDITVSVLKMDELFYVSFFRGDHDGMMVGKKTSAEEALHYAKRLAEFLGIRYVPGAVDASL